MTHMILSGALLAALSAASSDAAIQPEDSPRVPPALADGNALKIVELRQRSRLLLDERPGAGRVVGAVALVTLGIPTAFAGTIGLLLPVDGSRGGFITFGPEWRLAGIGALGLGVTLITSGIWLAVTGSIRRQAIDAELNQIDARIKRLERSQVPPVEVGLPVEAPLQLARF